MFRHSLASLQRHLILIASLPSALALIGLMIWQGYSGYLVALVALAALSAIGYSALFAQRFHQHRTQVFVRVQAQGRELLGIRFKLA